MSSVRAIATSPVAGTINNDNALGENSSLLLAVDGSDVGTAAIKVAADLAATTGCGIEVLNVERLQTLPPVPPSPGIATDLLDWTVPTHRRRLQLRGQVDKAAGRRTDWPIAVERGIPAQIIAEEAKRRGSSLIALGLLPHNVFDRLMNRSTALAVVRQATVPVLAVTPGLSRAPRRIVVAIDFSRASLRAARVALGLLPDGGTLLLTHVTPDFRRASETTEGWEIVYSQGIAAAMTRLQEELKAPPEVRIEPVFIGGPVVDALVAFSSAAKADLIAVGTHRHTFVDRLIVGSVTEALIRNARHSLLISPPSNR